MSSAVTEDVSCTQEGIMSQILIAFGQGTGCVRASQRAAMALRGRYYQHIAESGIIEKWRDHAMQVLERIRTIGRVAALKATERGDTTISEEDVIIAIVMVERESDTSWCPPRPA